VAEREKLTGSTIATAVPSDIAPRSIQVPMPTSPPRLALLKNRKPTAAPSTDVPRDLGDLGDIQRR